MRQCSPVVDLDKSLIVISAFHIVRHRINLRIHGTCLNLIFTSSHSIASHHSFIIFLECRALSRDVFPWRQVVSHMSHDVLLQELEARLGKHRGVDEVVTEGGVVGTL